MWLLGAWHWPLLGGVMSVFKEPKRLLMTPEKKKKYSDFRYNISLWKLGI